MRRSRVRIPLAPPPEGRWSCTTAGQRSSSFPGLLTDEDGDPVIPREIPREARLRLPTSAHVRALPAVICPHLMDMREHTDIPLVRTRLWTMDDVYARRRVAESTVDTCRKRGTAPRA